MQCEEVRTSERKIIGFEAEECQCHMLDGDGPGNLKLNLKLELKVRRLGLRPM